MASGHYGNDFDRALAVAFMHENGVTSSLKKQIDADTPATQTLDREV
jgi:hypothetical protein